MVRIDVVVTRGGDGGETSLGDGSRVPKSDPRIAAMGAIDEANAAIGLARLHAAGEADAILGRVQHDLFDLGADICVPAAPEAKQRIGAAQLARLEDEIAAVNARLAPLTSFVLPGGSAGAAAAHLARAVVRRAERDLAAVPDVDPAVRRYINRLSDHLFVLARALNDDGARDVLWTPAAPRSGV